MGVMDASDSRLALLRQWVTEDLGFAGGRIEPASADASFRRYFRLIRGADSYIVMDAPPDKEPLEPFVGVAQSLFGIGLNVPVILARDCGRGLLLLSDLGTRQYLTSCSRGATSSVSTVMRSMRWCVCRPAAGKRRVRCRPMIAPCSFGKWS